MTTKLGAGQSWDDYTVRVELEQNGQKISKVERISLNAGESRELTIDVNAAQVAQAGSVLRGSVVLRVHRDPPGKAKSRELPMRCKL